MILQETKKTQTSLTETLHRLTVNPLTGFPLLVIILYFGVYKFVGEFGAGELVDRIEGFYEKFKSNIQSNLERIQFLELEIPQIVIIILIMRIAGLKSKAIAFNNKTIHRFYRKAL